MAHTELETVSELFCAEDNKRNHGQQQLFKEEESAMLKIQFFVVHIFSLSTRILLTNYLITTCHQFSKHHLSTPKISDFEILNQGNRLTQTKQLTAALLFQSRTKLKIYINSFNSTLLHGTPRRLFEGLCNLYQTLFKCHRSIEIKFHHSCYGWK